jgi:hypothetical protein
VLHIKDPPERETITWKRKKERKKERRGKVNVRILAANNDLVSNNGKKAVKSIQL